MLNPQWCVKVTVSANLFCFAKLNTEKHFEYCGRIELNNAACPLFISYLASAPQAQEANTRFSHYRMDCNNNCSLSSSGILDKEAAVRCIVLNETSQSLIREAVSCIEAEIAQLRKEVSACFLHYRKQTEPLDSSKVTYPSYVNANSNYVCRPFFRAEGNMVSYLSEVYRLVSTTERRCANTFELEGDKCC